MSCIYIALFLLVIDQISKLLILKNFQPGQSLPIIKNVFHISLVCNKGGAFGIFSQTGSVFFPLISYISITIIIIIFISWRRILKQKKSTLILLSLVLGGAIGNLIDRIRFGCVIDFLDFRIWPVFNIADCAISIGLILLIIQMLRLNKHETLNMKH